MVGPDQSQASHSAGSGVTPEPAGEPIPWKDVLEVAHSIALRICGARYAHLADDIAQESAVRLLKNSGRITSGWRQLLYKIAVNRARSCLQRERRSESLVGPDSASVEVAPAETPGPLAQVLAGELELELKALLGKLDLMFGLGTRAIVEFRSKGIPWKEIVGIVVLPDRTCRLRHKKAEAWITKHLSLHLRKGGEHD